MKRVFNLVVAVTWVLGLNAPVLADLSEAEKLIEEGKLDAALAAVDVMLMHNSSDLEARFLKGMILTGQARDEEAIKIFTALTQDHPALPEPYNNLGVLFTQQGDYDNARAALHAAILIHPSYSIAHENLGDLYAKMASHYYDRALEEDRLNESVRLKQSKLNSLLSVPEPERVKAATKKPSLVTSVVESEENRVIKEAEPPLLEPEHAGPQTAEGRQKAILSTVDGWSAAWSAQNADAFFSYYSRNFRPRNGLTHEEWVAQRRERLQKPSFIKVRIDQPKVVIAGDATARVEFVQTYRTDSYSDQVLKILDMRRENGNWKIYREQPNALNWHVFREHAESQ